MLDEGNKHVSFFAVFSGTHTGEGGPLDPTGLRGTVDYVYALEFVVLKILARYKSYKPLLIKHLEKVL